MLNKYSKLTLPFIFLFFIAASICSCSRGYDADKCAELSEKTLEHQQVSQDDYSEMLTQYDYILTYLIDRMQELSKEEDDFARFEKARALRDDKEYMERFSYMMTFGSLLYRADVNSLFDAENKEFYDRVNSRADEFARLSEKI